MIVKAYKAGKSLRVTVPKSYFAMFATFSEQAGAGSVPCLLLYASYKNLNNVEPYFTNCDFGLNLYVNQDGAFTDNLRCFGKTSLGFTISQDLAQWLGLVENAKLECQILENTRPSKGFFSKIIGYTILR